MRALTQANSRLARGVALLLIVPLTLAGARAASADDGGAGKALVTTDDPQAVANQDPALVAEMNRQAELQPAVDALQGAGVEASSGIAGVAYEGSGVTLYYKGALNRRMTAAVRTAQRYGSITVTAAAWSRGELQAASDRITTLAARDGSDIQAVELETDGSGLTVERMPAASAGAMTAKRAAAGRPPLVPAGNLVAAAAVEVPITYATAAAPIQLLTSRTDDFSPWNGGSRWEAWRNGAFRYSCTTGFGVKNNAGERFVLSAAHCATPPDYARQGSGASLEYMGPVYQQSVYYDLLIIRANGSDLIFDGTATTTNTRRVSGWAYWAANQLVCQSGTTVAPSADCGRKGASTSRSAAATPTGTATTPCSDSSRRSRTVVAPPAAPATAAARCSPSAGRTPLPRAPCRPVPAALCTSRTGPT